jgi:hypothetical protein
MEQRISKKMEQSDDVGNGGNIFNGTTTLVQFRERII